MNNEISLYVLYYVISPGAIGGLLNCAIMGEFVMPHFTDKIWRAGWIGNLVISAGAAFVVWGMNGSLSAYDVIAGQQTEMHLTISQLASSIVVGLGGSNILSQMAQKQSERIAKEILASSMLNTQR